MFLLLFAGYVHAHVLSSDSLDLLRSHYSWYIRMCSSGLGFTKSYTILILRKLSKSSQFCHPVIMSQLLFCLHRNSEFNRMIALRFVSFSCSHWVVSVAIVFSIALRRTCEGREELNVSTPCKDDNGDILLLYIV